LALGLICLPLLAEIPGFPKDPAISPDGKEVCFVYDDDLWIVPFQGGDARRLTSTKASEWGPIWSPNGRWIAFVSNREGLSYPYLISASGGEAQVIIRESYSIADWFNDSKHLLVLRGNVEFGSSMYKLPISGERPTLLGEVGERWASLSADDRQIVFSRNGYAHREAYTGSKNGELWLFDIASKEYTQLTRTEHSERYPRYSQSSNSLYYCYSDGQSFQLNRVDKMNFKRPVKISNLPRFSARDITIARANDRIVFEYFDEIYKYDPASSKANKITKLDIRIASDMWQNPIREFEMKNDLADFAVSDDEMLVSFSYKYDNFIVPRKGGEPKQLTDDHSGWANAIFINDRQLVLSKLDHGREKLFTTTIEKGKEPVLTPIEWFGADSLSIQDIHKDAQGRWQIKYQDHISAGRIALADKGKTDLLAMNTPGLVISDFAINKSGSHAAYCSIDSEYYMRGLYIYEFATDSHRKVLSDDRNISSIHWSKDNRSLIFTRNRNLYRLDLVPRDEYEYDEDFWAQVFEPPKEEAEKKEESGSEGEDETEDKAKTEDEATIDEDGLFVMEITSNDKEEEKPDPPVEIVWEGLDKRLFELYQGSMSNLYVIRVLSDSTFLYLDRPWFAQEKPSLNKGDIYGKNKKEQATFGKDSIAFKLVGETLYYLDDFALKSYDLNGGKKNDIPISMDYAYDVQKLNGRVFEQAWGLFADNFYDPNFHGQNWQTLYDEYRPYVDKARDINDVGGIIDEMVGDLNASHTGFYPRQDEASNYKYIARLGIEFEYNETLPQGIKISRVYPNTRLASYYKIKAGDILTHIDKVEILPQTALDSLLIDKVGKLISFSILSDGKVIEGQVQGLGGREYYQLYYEFKINRSRQKVDEASGGRVGYIHVPSMGTEDYDNFYRDYFRDNQDKKAMILDFRGNSGGRVHEDIISLLTKKKYGYSLSRTYGPDLRPEPRFGITVPTIVLVDENSFSDGEIFPIIYKELKLGKVVGYPSSGAVIGTREHTLLDGSRMRMPGTGWFKVDGTNMEGSGAMPDIIVEHSLNDIVANDDKQLSRAIKEILREIK
jgi:C-terminal processing protease CtpA/Prc/tricorn protease-like protein